MNKTLLFFTAILFIVAGLTMISLARRQSDDANVQGASESNVSPAANWTPGEPIEDFTLVERTGQQFGSKDLEGKVWVANFFFSTCPASCRQQNSRMAELQKELGPDGVRFVSITCDPETDTPETLANYARSFNADPNQWKFLTGDLTYISYIGREVFDVTVMPKGHTEKFILVDQNGVVRGYYGWDKPLEIDQLKKTIRGLLDGSIAPLEKPEKPVTKESPEIPQFEEELADETPSTLESPQYEYETADVP